MYAAFQKEIDNDIDIANIMSTWVVQAGYPVVNVNVQSNRKEISVTQKRFLLANPDRDDKQIWEVPLTYATSLENNDFNNTKSTLILSKGQLSIEFEKEIEWIVFNVQQTGK